MKRLLSFVPHVFAIAIAAVFLDSLRYKFTDHVNTQVIFGKLDAWAATLGAAGIFAPGGIFSQYVIGSAELLASILLLVGIYSPLRKVQGIGALLAFFIMTGAITFHLFTPLGTDPNNDGGGLFITACVVWLMSAVLVGMRRKELVGFLRRDTHVAP